MESFHSTILQNFDINTNSECRNLPVHTEDNPPMMIITYKNKTIYTINSIDEFMSFLGDIDKAEQINTTNEDFMNSLFEKYNNNNWTLVTFKQSWGKNFKGKSRFQPIFWETRGFNSDESEKKAKQFSSTAVSNLHSSRSPEERKKNAVKANKQRIKQMRELEKSDPQKFKEQLSTTLEFYLAKGLCLEDAEKALKERQSTFSKKKLIEKYGEEDGLKMLEDRNNKWINSLKENNNWNELSKSKAVTLQKSITKYGEEDGTKRYNNWIEKTNQSKDAFITRYGEEIGLSKYIEKNKKVGYANTKEYYLERYGEKEGLSKWKERLDKISVSQGKASQESLNVFLPLLEIYRNKFTCYLGYDGYNEWFIWDNDSNEQRRYDFTLREAKLIIEYNGETFHPNKNTLTESEWNVWVSPFTKETADEVYCKDREKIRIAIENGFKVLELWSSASVEENIKIAQRFIEENTIIS